MILGYHVILSAYGFWLPNDPRGSYSMFVGSTALFRFGRATTVSTRSSVAAAPHDRRMRRQAKQALSRPAVRFSGVQARAVARGFAWTAGSRGIVIWACAIMPDHSHLVVAACDMGIDGIVSILKADSTRMLVRERLHPFAGHRTADGRLPSIWAVGNWVVHLRSRDAILRTIGNVDENPVKAGLRRQMWSFVTPYEA